MERKVHLFVRQLPGVGYAMSLLSDPAMSSFAPDIESARAQLGAAIARRFTYDRSFADSWVGLTDVRIRRVEVVLRVLQGDRLLPVPMRFTAVVHKSLQISSVKGAAEVSGVRVLIPRLGEAHSLQRVEDVEGFVEEIVRHRLFLARAEQVLALSYEGDETVESITISYREKYPSDERPSAREETAKDVPEILRGTCRDLVSDAKNAVIERAFSRDTVVDTVQRLLSARRRSSVLLVGPKGIGKTAIAYELAHRALEADRADRLEFWQTSGARIIAGMRYLGEWQERVKSMLDALRSRPAVLHIEDINELFAATGGDDKSSEISQYFAAAMETDALVLLCEATAEDVARAEKTHPAFMRALRTVVVPTLELSQARAALEWVAARIAKQRNTRFTNDALQRVLELCERFGDGTALPGSGVALLHSVASSVDGRSQQKHERISLTSQSVVAAFSKRTGYPSALIDHTVALDPASVFAALQARVVGQPEALSLLRDLVVSLKTGMVDPARPLGSFLFLGPTGVGKTESALALAAYLFGDDRRVMRFDMSEFAAPGSANRLISDAPGVQGSLTRRVREQPFGVVLLDEIEKADNGVHDLLLQILGEGRLTDSLGHTVSFRNSVVILTSNLGADTVNRSLGFADGASGDVASHYVSAATKFFRPELLNRMDHIVPFQPLSAETIERITRSSLEKALAREGLARRSVRVRYDDGIVQRLASLGFDRKLGARPLKRVIEQWVIGPISRLLAARGSAQLGEIELVVRGDGIAIAPTSTPEVTMMSDDAISEELRRRAGLSSLRSIELLFDSVDHSGHARASWLAEQYARWSEQHFGHSTLAVGEQGVVSLTVEGPIAGLLSREAGTHEFEAGKSIAKVRVRSTEGSSVAVRLYTAIPEEAVWDVSTEFECIGMWQRSLETALLNRLVLARCAVAP